MDILGALLLLALPAISLAVGGIVAFIMLPVKAGIAIALLAFIAAVAVGSWMLGSIDLSR